MKTTRNEIRPLNENELTDINGGLGWACTAIDWVLNRPVRRLFERFGDTPEGHANRRLQNMERKIRTGR